MLILIKFNSSNDEVGFRHFRPDTIPASDLIQLIEDGAIYVDAIPKEVQQVGKVAVMCYNETDKLYYKYIDTQRTIEDTNAEKIEELQQSIAEISMLLISPQ